MKKIRFFFILSSLSFLLLTETCKDEETVITTLPVVSTESVTSFTSTMATLGGNVTSDGGAAVTDRGIFFGTAENPEISGMKFQMGSGTGPFSDVVINLTANTKY